MELHERIEQVETREQLAGFVEALLIDLRSNPADWENATLERFLGAMAAWIRAMPAAYENMGREMPDDSTWRALADILLASKMYE